MVNPIQTNQQTLDISAAIEQAIKHHQAGRLNQAERIYRQVLHFSPNNVLANHHLGIIAHQVGKLDRAVQLIGKALAVKPDYAEAHYNLGNTLKKQGKLSEAADCFRKAVSIKPDYAKAHYNLGNTFQEQGKINEAIVCYREALSINPDYAEAHNNLGAMLFERGKIEEALACCRKALSIKPDYAKAHYNLGNMLHEQGELNEAADCFRKALSIKPDYAEAYNTLGSTLQEQGRLDEAVDCCRKALSIKPEYAEAHNNLGVTFQEQGKFDEAEGCFRKTLVIKPDLAEVHYNMGNLLKQQGKIDEAIDCLRKAVSLKPDYAEAHSNLASAYTYTAKDQQLQLMEDFFNKKEMSDTDRMHLAFGLGKAYEDLQQFDIAFEFLRQANMLKRRTYDYSLANDQDRFSTVKKIFDHSYMTKNKGAGVLDDSPIFILGMPRSGTSLVEQILASHPLVYGAGELTLLEKIVLGFSKDGSLNAAFDRMAREGADLATQVGTQYIKKIREHSGTAKFITDKMPYNFLYIGLIHLALPNARIIHCVREPMDTCLSIFKNCFRFGHGFAYDQQELGRYYLMYQDIMRHWHEVVPGIIYDISYEELVQDQEEQTSKLLQHCELPWDDVCLSFHKTSRIVATASSVQVRKPLYRDSVQLWKKYEKQLEPLGTLLKPEIGC